MASGLCRRFVPKAGRGLGDGVENVVVRQLAVGRQNLLASASGGYGLKDAIQLLWEIILCHIGPNASLTVPVLAALAMPFWLKSLVTTGESGSGHAGAGRGSTSGIN